MAGNPYVSACDELAAAIERLTHLGLEVASVGIPERLAIALARELGPTVTVEQMRGMREIKFMGLVAKIVAGDRIMLGVAL